MPEDVDLFGCRFGLQLIGIRTSVPGQCRGVARDMYLTKNSLGQKLPELVVYVEALDTA